MNTNSTIAELLLALDERQDVVTREMDINHPIKTGVNSPEAREYYRLYNEHTKISATRNTVTRLIREGI